MNYKYASKEQKEIRIEKMLKMRSEGLMNTKIAEKFGISRERVRQLIGNGSYESRREYTKKLILNTDVSNMTREEIEKLPGMKKYWEKAAGSRRHKSRAHGVGEEILAHQILIDAGINNELMPSHHPYDILTDSGIRIDVKHSNYNVGNIKSQRCASPTYNITHLKNGKDCDFFMVLVPDRIKKYAVFIIPSNMVPKTSTNIRVVWPPSTNKKSKWVNYKDRYDLLEGSCL